MSAINTRSTILNGIWIQETYEGSVEASKGNTICLNRHYQLRKVGNSRNNPTQEMHQTEAYAAIQSFILRFQYAIDYITNEGSVTMWATKIRVKTTKKDYPVYHGDVTWEFDNRRPNYITQPVTWSDRMSDCIRKLVYPLMPQRYYSHPGHGIIPFAGINYNSKSRVYEGVDCYSPEWKMIAKQQLLASIVTPAHRRMLQWLSKTVNALPFRGFDPGTVLYLGADIDESMHHNKKIIDLTHQFIVEPNLENFYVEGIHVDIKRGHEYLWISSCETENGPRTYQINVAPMYASTNLNLLGLG